MFKPQKIFMLILLLMCIASTSYAATMPAGIQSFAPIGTVADNVSFRVVFRAPVVKRDEVNKIITPENPRFPFEVNQPLQLEGRWQNDRTFTAQLLAPLRSATTYTATIREGLRDRRGGRIGPGSFRFQTEGLSPTDIKASMGRDGNAYFDIGFNMRIDPARLKGFMRILNDQGKEMYYSINGSLPARSIRVAVPVQKTASRQRFTVMIAAGLKSGEGDMGIDKDYSKIVILDPELMVRDLDPGEGYIRASFNFGVDTDTAKSFITIEPSVKNVTYETGWSDENFVIRAEDFKPRSRFVITFRKGFPSKGGLVLKEDYKQAVTWYRKAAENGHVEAMRSLAEIYRKNNEPDEAMRWYKKVNAEALKMFDDIQPRESVPQPEPVREPDPVSAPPTSPEDIRKSAEYGDAESQYTLGMMYFNGQGVFMDYKEAVKWLEIAGNAGHSWAQLQLGRMYYSGIGVKKDERHGVNRMKKAAELGNAEAQYTLAKIYRQGNWKNFQQALAWCSAAAVQNHHEAQVMLAEMYRDSGDKRQYQYWRKKVLEHNDKNRRHNI